MRGRAGCFICANGNRELYLLDSPRTGKTVLADSELYDPWDSWEKQVVRKFSAEQVYEITSRLGELPKASIAQAFKRDPRRSIVYACSDSQATLRILPVLKQRAERYHGRVMAGDIDR